MDQAQEFEAERPRLTGLAARVLGDHAEAEDIVQQAWLRLHGTDTHIESLPAWLTTVTTRLCLDRLRSRTPVPHDDLEIRETSPDTADEVVLADTVGVALQAVIDRLTPRERVAFVLHDSFGFDFPTIAAFCSERVRRAIAAHSDSGGEDVDFTVLTEEQLVKVLRAAQTERPA